MKGKVYSAYPVNEVQRVFLATTRIAARLMGSTATWSEADFEELSNAYAQLAHEHPQLYALVGTLRPLAALDRVMEKLQKRPGGNRKAQAA